MSNNNNSAKVLISMPEEFLKQLDAVAAIEGRTRSELIAEALRTYLMRNNQNSRSYNRNANLLEALLG